MTPIVSYDNCAAEPVSLETQSYVFDVCRCNNKNNNNNNNKKNNSDHLIIVPPSLCHLRFSHMYSVFHLLFEKAQVPSSFAHSGLSQYSYGLSQNSLGLNQNGLGPIINKIKQEHEWSWSQPIVNDNDDDKDNYNDDRNNTDSHDNNGSHKWISS